MTVRELITLLSEVPDLDAEVTLADDGSSLDSIEELPKHGAVQFHFMCEA